jgi:hypothetical protein
VGCGIALRPRADWLVTEEGDSDRLKVEWLRFILSIQAGERPRDFGVSSTDLTAEGEACRLRRAPRSFSTVKKLAGASRNGRMEAV